ncbi:MAG: DUF1800 domain-containing protein [Thermomicrobiales bacterium]
MAMADLDPHARIAHLLRRAGFGASEAELNDYVALGFEASVDRLLNPQAVADDLDQQVANLAAKLGYNLNDTLADLQTIWLYRMVNTKRPLQEKMSLFWHGHFATANSKVNSPFLMNQQYQLFNRLGLGNFRDLVLGVSKDPAMLIWLDGNQNRKAAPNENYGRELMELFTLGIGNYTENDVHAAAHAFTGWFFRGQRETTGKHYVSAEFFFNANQHDNGAKTFLGQTGNWNGDDVIDIILRQPACSRFIAGKLFSFFVWDNPDAATAQPFADILVQNKYDLRETMRAILLSPQFSSQQAYHARIKSPVELVATLMRTLGVTAPVRAAAASTRQMGQELFNPPNVGGWTNGPGWISTSSLLERFNVANRLITARQANGAAPLVFDPGKLLNGKGFTTAEQLVDYFTGLLLDGDLSADQRSALIGYLQRNDAGQPTTFTLDAKTLDSKVRGLIHLTTAVPSYQLN